MRTISIIAVLAVAIMLWVAPGVEAFLRLHLGGLPASGQTSGCPPGMTCLTPTGDATTDTNALQAAVNIAPAAGQSSPPPIWLAPGSFEICSPISITQKGTMIMGPLGYSIAGVGGSVPPYGYLTRVYCHTDGTFTFGASPQGMFEVHADSVHFSGFRIKGREHDHNGVAIDCIDLMNASGAVIDGWMSLEDCYDAVHQEGNGNVSAPNPYTQNTHITSTYITYPGRYAIWCDVPAGQGGGCTDWFWGPDVEIESPGWELTGGALWGGIWCGSGCGHGHIYGMTIEDGKYCMVFNGSSDVIIRGIRCEKGANISATNTAGISLVASQLVGYSGSAPYMLSFSGTNTGWVVTDNAVPNWSAACYHADAGATLSGVFSNNYCFSSLYDNATSEAIIDPLVNPHPLGGASMGNTGLVFAQPDWQYGLDVTLPLQHGANTLPNPIYTAAGQKGSFSIAQSPVGGDTIGTYGGQYIGTPPTLSSGAYVVDTFPFLTNPQGNIVIGAKLASVTPSANLLTGGNAMTSGWSTGGQNSTGGWVTNVVADPVGTTTAARFIEDVPGSGSIKHTVGQSVSLSANTTYTCAIWFSQGTSGNRNVAIQIYDASFGNGAWVFFNGANGANIGQSGGTIIASGNAGVLPPGYVRPYLTFSLATAPANLYFYLVNGTALQYTGDGTSNGYFWGPTCRLGTAP